MPAKILQRNTKAFKKIRVDTVTIDIIESALRNARFEMDTVLFRHRHVARYPRAA